MSEKSTEFAMQQLVTRIERTPDAKEIARCTFLNIGKTVPSINEASKAHSIEEAIVGWIMSMLVTRLIMIQKAQPISDGNYKYEVSSSRYYGVMLWMTWLPV